MRVAMLSALLLVGVPVFVYAQMQDDQLAANFTLSANPRTLHLGLPGAGGGVLGSRSNGSLLGIDSLPKLEQLLLPVRV